MGKLKQKDTDFKTYVLNEKEFNYLKILKAALAFNIWHDKIISGFLYHVCQTRFSYPVDKNLVFEIDLDNDKRELKVREVTEPPIAPQEPPAAAGEQN